MIKPPPPQLPSTPHTHTPRTRPLSFSEPRTTTTTTNNFWKYAGQTPPTRPTPPPTPPHFRFLPERRDNAVFSNVLLRRKCLFLSVSVQRKPRRRRSKTTLLFWGGNLGGGELFCPQQFRERLSLYALFCRSSRRESARARLLSLSLSLSAYFGLCDCAHAFPPRSSCSPYFPRSFLYSSFLGSCRPTHCPLPRPRSVINRERLDLSRLSLFLCSYADSQGAPPPPTSFHPPPGCAPPLPISLHHTTTPTPPPVVSFSLPS